MTHIVCAIGGEAGRARDDWETALLCAETERVDDSPSRPANAHLQDNYCFEMLSLVSTIDHPYILSRRGGQKVKVHIFRPHKHFVLPTGYCDRVIYSL